MCWKYPKTLHSPYREDAGSAGFLLLFTSILSVSIFERDKRGTVNTEVHHQYRPRPCLCFYKSLGAGWTNPLHAHPVQPSLGARLCAITNRTPIRVVCSHGGYGSHHFPELLFFAEYSRTVRVTRHSLRLVLDRTHVA